MDDRSRDPAEELDALIDGRGTGAPGHLAPLLDAARQLHVALLAHDLDPQVADAQVAGLVEADALPRRRWPQRALIAVLAAALACTLAFTASEGALPGSRFYPVKRASERVSLAAAVTPQRQAAERTRIALRRCEEVEALLARGDRARLAGAQDDMLRSMYSARAAIERARAHGASPAVVARWRSELLEVEREAGELGLAAPRRERARAAT